MSDKEIINMMFQAFLQIQKMEVPYAIKNKMLGALFNMTPNGWRVVGITEKAIYRFKNYDFKYKSGMGINRSHKVPRHKRNRYLLQNENWNVESWWKYYYERDKCILATSTENMNKEPLISKFRVPKNLFRSSGFSFKVKEAESNFLENAYNKLNEK